MFPFDLRSNLTLPTTTAPVSQPDLQDYLGTGVLQNARYIDPLTQDFVLSSEGHYLGINGVDQAVQLSLLTTFNSSSVPTLGNQFGSILMITSAIRYQIESQINTAMALLLNDNSITLSPISITLPNPGQVLVSFTYVNNTIKSPGNGAQTVQFSLT